VGAAAALRTDLGTPLPPADQVVYDQGVDAARRALGDNAFATAWEVGQSLPLEQAIDLAVRPLLGSDADTQGRAQPP
jgi:hypothetical protein